MASWEGWQEYATAAVAASSGAWNGWNGGGAQRGVAWNGWNGGGAAAVGGRAPGPTWKEASLSSDTGKSQTLVEWQS